jgi:anti-anti-sigma factor
MTPLEAATASPSMHVTFVMRSHPRYLPIVRATVRQLAATAGCDETESRAITLAIDEALANIIRHAYHGRADGGIELHCRSGEDELQFQIKDAGDAPDPARICAREVGCDAIGGLGAHYPGRYGQRVLPDYARRKLVHRGQAASEASVTISVRQLGLARIVALEGEVDLGTSPDLRRTLFELLEVAQELAINLRAIRYIDSSGIATLIEALKAAPGLRRDFVLFGRSPAVSDVFRLTHVNHIFRIRETEEEAITPE